MMFKYISQTSAIHAFTMGLNFAFMIYVANLFDVKEFAYFALVNTFIVSGTMFCELGINQSLVRFLSKGIKEKDKSAQYTHWANHKKQRNLLLFAPALLLYYCATQDIAISSLFGVVLSLIVVLQTIWLQTKMSEHQAQLKFKTYGALMILLRSAPIVVFVIFSHIADLTTMHYLSIQAAVAFLLNLVFAQNATSGLKKNKMSEPLLSTNEEKDFYKFNLRSSFIVLIIMNLDIYYLGNFANPEALAQYYAASRLVLPLMSFIAVYNLVLWPMLNRMDLVATKLIMRKQIKIASFLAVFAMSYVACAANLYELVYGQKYGELTNLIWLLGFRYVVGLIATPLGMIAYNLGFVRIAWKMNLMQLATYLALLLLLPEGVISIAGALLSIELFGLIFILFFFIYRNRVGA